MRVWLLTWLSRDVSKLLSLVTECYWNSKPSMCITSYFGTCWCRKRANGHGNPLSCHCHYQAVKGVSRWALPGPGHLTQRLLSLHQWKQQSQVCREHKNYPSYCYSAKCHLLKQKKITIFFQKWKPFQGWREGQRSWQRAKTRSRSWQRRLLCLGRCRNISKTQRPVLEWRQGAGAGAGPGQTQIPQRPIPLIPGNW